MKIELQGLSKWEKRIMKLVLLWIPLAIVLVQIGIFHGRKLERNCWENALEEVNHEYEQLLLLERIIKLESNGKHEGIWGDNGRSYGLAQFSADTFFWLAEKMGLENPDWTSWQDQIVVLNYAVRSGFGKHWSTFEKAKGNDQQ